MACSSALRAEGRPWFYGTEPGPSHGRPQEGEAWPSPLRAQQDPPRTRLRALAAARDRALACDGKENQARDCSSGVALFRGMKSNFGEAAAVPWLRSGTLLDRPFAVGPELLGLSSDSARDSPVEQPKHGA